MSVTTIERTEVRCQNCPRTFPVPADGYGMPTQDAARAVGWTVWEGVTLGGKPAKRVFCPWCAGRREDLQEPKWDARCETCGASASEEDGYADEPFGPEEAKWWQQEHRCEPDVWLVQPGGGVVRR